MATVYIKSTGRAESINGREVAPLNAHENMFPNRSVVDGPEAIAVPGAIKGYWEMHQKYGRLPWATLFQPAIELCRTGTVVNPILGPILQMHQKVFEKNGRLGEIFLNPETGKVWRVGDRIRRPQLAETLEILAAEGADSMYHAEGTILKRILSDLSDVGSILSESDFTGYKAQWLEPETITMGSNLKMFTSPLPATGFLVAFTLKVLDGLKMDESALSVHRIIETFKYAFASRTKMGDPQFEDGVQSIVDELLSDENVENVRQIIDDERTHQDYQHYGAVYSFKMDHGTANMNILAPNGDAISVTSSLNN